MATDTNKGWYKIAESIAEINFSSNGLALVEAAGKTVTIALHNDQLFACPKKCPHAGGILADGYIDPVGNIVCPLHHYKYSLQNGRNTSGEGYYLKRFEVELREDGVYINISNRLI
ncbi:MAG: Rieske 2Fe-2S domain-containing protein [Ferruginibacter sp.]